MKSLKINTHVSLFCRTYFIEYQFPVVATSRDKHAPNAMATEVTRVASKNIKDGGNINKQYQACSSILLCLSYLLDCFQIQNLKLFLLFFSCDVQSSFSLPNHVWWNCSGQLVEVCFDLQTVRKVHWTESGMYHFKSSQYTLQIYFTIFTLLINWTKRILMYRAHSFFQPNQVGSCGIPLKSILKSDSFHLDSSLDIQENSISRPGSASRRGGSDVEGFYGKLKVGVQIVKRSFLKTVCKGQFWYMCGLKGTAYIK